VYVIDDDEEWFMHLLRLTLILWVMSCSSPAMGDSAVTESAIAATPGQLQTAAAAASTVAKRDTAVPAADLPGTQRGSGWLMAIIALILIGYQLRRKHRFLRPHRFTDL
jgi:hypothetical protein